MGSCTSLNESAKILSKRISHQNWLHLVLISNGLTTQLRNLQKGNNNSLTIEKKKIRMDIRNSKNLGIFKRNLRKFSDLSVMGSTENCKCHFCEQ